VLLTDTISKLTGVTSVPNATDNLYNPFLINNNRYVRSKRNVLGNILQIITGVATTDDLQRTLKIEEDMKNKLTTALSHQTSYEKVISTSISNITRETEALLDHLQDLANTHHKDKLISDKLHTHYQVFMEDVEKLEDIIQAVWSGAVSVRHATYLSSKAGLHQIAHFRYLDTTSSPTGPSFRFTTRIYRTVEMVSLTPMNGDVILVETMDRLYHVHPSYDLSLPLTELEVTGSRSPCHDCALLVHIGNHNYRTYQKGALACKTGNQEDLKNLTRGSQIQIKPPTTCINRAVQIGSLSLRIRSFNIDTSRDKTVDALLLRKDMDNHVVHAENPDTAKTTHDLMNLRLAHDLASADQDINNLVQDNSIQLEETRLHTIISAGWLLGISVFVLVVVFLILWRYCAILRRSKQQPSLPQVI
jgi:hypothetical protein